MSKSLIFEKTLYLLLFNQNKLYFKTNQLRRSSSYCLELVKKHDYENFLVTLLSPNLKVRNDIFAIRALNTEISLIRDNVTQKEIGLGRLFFWRDAIAQLFQLKVNGENTKKLPHHPVIQELNKTIIENELSKKWFTNLVESRERIMSDAPFSTLEDLEKYCDQSITPILYLSLELLGIKNIDVDHAASHLGKSIGLATFIRSIPHNSQRRRILIPRELLVKHKLSQENFVRFKEKEKIQDLTFEIASQANSHYEKAKTLEKSIKKSIVSIFLSGTPTEIYLKRLQRANFNPYDSSLLKRYGLLPVHLYYRKIRKTF